MYTNIPAPTPTHLSTHIDLVGDKNFVERAPPLSSCFAPDELLKGKMGKKQAHRHKYAVRAEQRESEKKRASRAYLATDM